MFTDDLCFEIESEDTNSKSFQLLSVLTQPYLVPTGHRAGLDLIGSKISINLALKHIGLQLKNMLNSWNENKLKEQYEKNDFYIFIFVPSQIAREIIDKLKTQSWFGCNVTQYLVQTREFHSLYVHEKII